MHFSCDFFSTCLPLIEFDGAINRLISTSGFAVDSRKVAPNEIFVALPGKRSDGHDFIKQAVENGACGLMIEKSRRSALDILSKRELKNIFIVLVDNVYESFLTLARFRRSQLTIPVVGITGSVGKTTTKEMLTASLQRAGMKCVASVGNQNTLLGAAMTLLRVRSDDVAVICEMGISKRGEMAELAKLVRPTFAAITTIGHAHMEGLGSLVDIANEKRAIFSQFDETSVGVINGDMAVLSAVSYQQPVIRVGCKMANQIQARKIHHYPHTTTCVIKIYNERYQISLPTGHAGHITNVLTAIALGHLLGIPHALLIDVVQETHCVAGRFESRQAIIHNGSATFINDCYNASPESSKSALLAFELMESRGKKIAVIGDMLELGVKAPFWHRQIGRFLRKVPSLQLVIFVGSHMQWAAKTKPYGLAMIAVTNWQEAKIVLAEQLEADSFVLVKGSRGVGLDNIIHSFCSTDAPLIMTNEHNISGVMHV